MKFDISKTDEIPPRIYDENHPRPEVQIPSKNSVKKIDIADPSVKYFEIEITKIEEFFSLIEEVSCSIIISKNIPEAIAIGYPEYSIEIYNGYRE